MAHRIRTYSEAVAEDDPPSDVLSEISSARRIVFLGFGFHSQNVRLLGSSASKRPTLRCFASIDGIREPRLELIKSDLAAELEVQDPAGLFFEGVRGTCEAFWEEYGDVVVH